MADGVASRLRSAGLKAGTIHVKIRDSSFRTITRQRTLADPTDLDRADLAGGARARPARGPRAEGPPARRDGQPNLGEREQLGMFGSDTGPDGGDRRRRATQAADAIRRRYGDAAVTRARLLGAGLPAPFERDPMKPLERRTGMHDPDAASESDETG